MQGRSWTAIANTITVCSFILPNVWHGTVLDVYLDHALVCACGVDLILRHSTIRDVMVVASVKAGTNATIASFISAHSSWRHMGEVWLLVQDSFILSLQKPAPLTSCTKWKAKTKDCCGASTSQFSERMLVHQS